MYAGQKEGMIESFIVDPASGETALTPMQAAKLAGAANVQPLPFESTNYIDLITDGDSPALGLVISSPEMEYKPGEPAEVFTSGVVPCIYGGAVTAGQELMPAAGGKLIVATAGKYVIGIARFTAGADEQGLVELRQYQKNP